MAKNWSDYFLESFNRAQDRSMQMAQFAVEAKFRRMKMDADMGIRGFDRMPDDQITQYLKNQNIKGYPVAGGGAAGFPEGTDFKDGYAFDKEGNVVGQYLEPPQAVNRGDGVLQVGDSFYKFNPELSRRMQGDSAGAPDLSDYRPQIQGAYPGLPGSVVPSTWRIGNQTYRYLPSVAETMGINAAPAVTAPNAGNVAPAAPTSAKTEGGASPLGMIAVRAAVVKAMKQKASKSEIVKGIKDEGYKPEDFKDLLRDYDPSISDYRKSFLDTLLKGIDFPGMRNVLNKKVDSKKR